MITEKSWSSMQWFVAGSLFLLTSPLETNPVMAQSTLPSTDNQLDYDRNQPLFPQLKPVPQTITVEKFEFVGNTVFSTEELNQIIAQYQNKPIAFVQLLQIADRITQAYVQKGYITSGAYIPSQELTSGVVKIQIVEGTLSDIDVTVVKGRLNPNYIRSRIAAGTTEPLNLNDLQTSLQLLQFDPLIDRLQAQLIAGTKPGTNILSIEVTGADTFKFSPILNNNRNPSIGSFEKGIQISEANLFGWGDRVNLAYRNTEGSDRFEVGYQLPINARNGSVGLSYSVSDNQIIEPPFEQLDIEIETQEFDLTVRQPILQTASADRTQELALSLSANRRNSNSRLLGVNFPISEEANQQGETDISALRFSQEWLQRSRQDVLSLRSQFNWGIDAFDATVNSDQPDSRFFSWRGQAVYSHLFNISSNPNLINPSIFLRSDLQLSATSLVAIEQLGLGGQSSIRGYRQDALLSDNGIIASAEIRVPVIQVPQLQSAVQVVPFVDFGKGWNTKRENPETTTLASVGLGLLWQSDNFSARLDWGIPLVELESSKRTWQENGVYFQLNSTF
ncbi:surface antigen (D15) [Stanieria cyanosphaera PCC 7437]|uniref:Surface antigen (D15) n=1 Tax=Stanieria cyanosphaera (strain ATCC 29371 / PCC 7437) TaxID=111780 RepID=K9XPH0_STAC7|nr:ShlB/FhaC/HecB family hemolysin secretion/activation protein [Stanieria cyanosphaera]AFZ34428.1 surface antigen (D15) [Stanieria cyanosphaera PCC 7437]